MSALDDSHGWTPPSRAILSLTALYFLAKPFYFWASGLPQLADLIALVIIMLSISNSYWRQSSNDSTRGLTVFVLFAFHATVVNLIAMLVTNGSNTFLYSSAFLIFNCMLAIAFARFHQTMGQELRRTLFYSVAASLVVQALLQLGTQDAYRAKGFFNNPNQLAYFALLSACIIIFVTHLGEGHLLTTVISLLAATFLVLASLSKAGIIAMGLLLALFVLSAARLSNRRVRATAGIFACLALFMSYSLASNSSTLFKRLETRFSSPDGDDNLSSRGYDRIGMYPETWVFGAGDGDYGRFGEDIEFHSTMGTVLVSYGVVGLSLMLVLFYIGLRRSGSIGIVVLLPVMSYGITHNGLRNSFLWILLALMVSMSRNRSGRGVQGAIQGLPASIKVRSSQQEVRKFQ